MRSPRLAGRAVVGIAAVTALLLLGSPGVAAGPKLAFSTPVTAIPLPPEGTPRYVPGEPRVIVTPTGRVIVSAHYQPWDCATGEPLLGTAKSCVWASDDGERFSVIGGLNDRLTVDVDLAQLPSGVLLETTMTNAAGLAATEAAPVNVVANGIPGSSIARSTDGGKTWTTTYDANNTLINDRPFFLVESEDSVFFVYTSIPGGIAAVRSTDSGASFGLPTVVTPPDLETRLVQMGGPSLDKARTQLLVPYVVGSEPTCTGGPSCLDRIGLARSSDHGVSWTSESLASLPLGSGVNSIHTVVSDAKGREYLVYSTGGDTSLGQHVWLMRNDGPGQPWTAPVKVDVPGTSAMLPWAVAEGDGHVGLAYYATSYLDAEGTARPWRIEAAVSTDRGESFVRTAVSDAAYVGTQADHRATVWDLLGLTLDGDNRLHVVWTDALGKPGTAQTVIRYAHQTSGPNLAPRRGAAPARPAAPQPAAPTATAATDTLPTTGLSPLLGVGAFGCLLLALGIRRRKAA